jgi:hypothetical protein
MLFIAQNKGFIMSKLFDELKKRAELRDEEIEK